MGAVQVIGGVAAALALGVALASPAPGRSPVPPDRSRPAPAAVGAIGGTGGSERLRLVLIDEIRGGLTPKSVVIAPDGHAFAQNMMYLHTVAVFDRQRRRIATLGERVVLGRFDDAWDRRPVRGAPVEAAVAPDGASVFVSNYSMYGGGFAHPGWDACDPADPIDPGIVYRIDAARLRIVDAIAVGRVPKFLAVTPDGRRLLVANWCSWDLSVVDLQRGREIARLPLGRYPRGIAIAPDSRTAWVTIVGERRVARVDLERLRVGHGIRDIGQRPRHVLFDPTGRYLYVSIQDERRVARVDLRDHRSIVSAPTGATPRSMALSADGRSLYVANYDSGTLTKIATSRMRAIQTVSLGYHPIGVAVDPPTCRVWVAGYTGSLWVLEERTRAGRRPRCEIEAPGADPPGPVPPMPDAAPLLRAYRSVLPN
jgi:YVTN family beta-propeller protein